MLINKLVYILLLFSINTYAQSQSYLEVTGQWQRIDSLSCFPEIINFGQDDYFVWLSEGDPCHINVEYGKWNINQDTLILTCKVFLHDELGNGKYLKKYKKYTEKYVLLLKNNRLYILGKYTLVKKKIKYIDYNENKGKAFDDNNRPYFFKIKF